MKKLTLLLAFIVISINLISQIPQAFKYQAVVRNDLGEVINNQTVSFQISIHDSIAAGPVVFQETHIVMTDAYGHANLEIGEGTPVTATISDIDWGTNDKYLEVELDPLGNTAYVSMGTTQLLAVPYAMYSESTGDTTRWKKNEDDLYFENGNVGIGTDSPGYWAKLDIKGNLSVDGSAYINHLDATESILDFYNSISDWELVGASDANRFDIRKWGDVPALSIDENNFVGIGTTSPTYNLDIMSNSTAASRLRLSNLDYSKTLFFSSGSDLFDPSIYFQGGDALRFMYYDGGYSELMRIQSNGNVGIGTDTILSKLHIQDENISLKETDIFNEVVTIEDYDAGLGLYSDQGGSYGSFLVMGEIVSGFLSDKWSIYRTTSIANPASQLRISFGSDPLYSLNRTLMAIDSSGRIGIGTTSPLAGLHLKGDQFPNSFLYLQSDDLQDAGIRFYEGNTDKWHIFNNALLGGLQIYNDIGQTVFFADQASANVGIGTTTPTEMLEVADTIYSSVGGFKFPDGTVQETAVPGVEVFAINDLADGKTGGGSVFLGPYAGENDDGSNNYNTAVGITALQFNVTGNENSAFGRSALKSNTTGIRNTAIGAYALVSDTSGYNNTATGTRALFHNTTGHDNTAIGEYALYSNTTADENTAIGGQALYSNTYGYSNTAIGSGVLFDNTTGFRNTAVGYRTNHENTTGYNNVSIGYYANYFNETGSGNTIIGYQAGRGGSAHTKNYSIFLGYQAGYYETGDNKLYIENSDTIAPLIYGEFDNDILAINGDLGVGTSAPSANLHIDGTDGALFEGTFGSGTLSATGSGTRLMWYPAKAAYRAGYVSGTQWDDTNIGDYSIAMGNGPTASGSNSIAIGRSADATGTASTSIGDYTEASGNYATSMGRSTIASGDYSTAMGTYINISGAGSFVIGDHSTTTAPTFTTDNRFYARFANGYRLYTNSSLGTGVQLLAGGTSWSTISDSTKKEKFKTVNGEDFLNKISQFKLTSWNFKGQDPSKFRHYGPMAQDFYAAFGNDGIGTIGNDTTLSSADFDGINFIAIQALEKRTSELKEKMIEVEELKSDLKALKEKNKRIEEQLAELTKDIQFIKSLAQVNTLKE